MSQCIFGNSLGDFTSSSKLSEVNVLVLAVFADAAGATAPGIAGQAQVRWIHSLAAGVDTLVPVLSTLEGAQQVPLTNAKGAFSRSLAEYGVAAMMHFNKQITRLQANRVSRTWEKFIMNELHGMTCGFIGCWVMALRAAKLCTAGFGDIAQHTAVLCRALGMRVVAWRNRKGLPGNNLAELVTYASDGPKAKQDGGR
eukprot:Skav205660  [mRNA]  locus=scaffold458:258565:260756:+ [translate_table: standard]